MKPHRNSKFVVLLPALNETTISGLTSVVTHGTLVLIAAYALLHLPSVRKPKDSAVSPIQVRTNHLLTKKPHTSSDALDPDFTKLSLNPAFLLAQNRDFSKFVLPQSDPAIRHNVQQQLGLDMSPFNSTPLRDSQRISRPAGLLNSETKPGYEGSPGSQPEGEKPDPSADDESVADATRIDLPRDGYFGAVVLGASLEQEYPELGAIWENREPHTAYLHIGFSDVWRLQFAPADPDVALGSEDSDRLEAPWPYRMWQPNLDEDSRLYAPVVVHGFVNTEGHFENLILVAPTDLPAGPRLLDALNHWQFRAARLNGQSIRVEIVLILPMQP